MITEKLLGPESSLWWRKGMLKSSNWIKIASLLAAMLLLILPVQWSGYFKKADKGDIVIGLARVAVTKNSMLKEE